MIHLLGWAAVTLVTAHSYLRRPFPPGKDHRAELPALAFGVVMFLILLILIQTSGAGGESSPVSLPDRQVIWMPVV